LGTLHPVTTAAVPIYAPRITPQRLGAEARVWAALVMLGCAAVLSTAAYLPPSPSGVGTHLNLGMARCDFLEKTGLPCPACGMTTSFSFMAHGQPLASMYVQPMGAVLVVLTAAAFWVSLYILVTGRPVLRLLQVVPSRYYLLPLMFFALAAWGWKIYIHTQGLDGWG
jgi:hypothetical protein